MEALEELYLRQAHRAEASPSMHQWVATTFDLAPETARLLVNAAHRWRGYPSVRNALEAGEITFDRAAVITRLPIGAGYEVDSSMAFDIAGLRRRVAHHRRVTRSDERRAFMERYCLVQPTLDESSWDVTGRLPGEEGRVFAKGLQERADEFRSLPGGEASTLGQRQADALTAMAQDSLSRRSDDEAGSTENGATVFVDLNEANGTGGESGAEIEYGPRVGPDTLEELLCTGSVRVIGLADGRPVVTSDATKAIPPAVRNAVAWRDQGCTIDACTSRYRLQPHHIVERRHGGTHDPDNLATLCWYHHHVAIHRQGFRIDPDSPPQRRRLIRTRAGPDPPW
jgi:hypothetical protein